jgi:aldehyde dehydrogenase (NAD+)
MNFLTDSSIDILLSKQKSFFDSNQTKPIAFRKNALKKLLTSCLKYEKDILKALHQDLRKSSEEAFLTEFSLVVSEIKLHLKNVNKWSASKRISTPLILRPSRSRIYYDPLGVNLVIAPWNYPFLLLFAPLIGVLSSGCCAILKPSADSHHTAEVMDKIIRETFEEEHITIVHGEKKENQILFKKRFDHIFFTGGSELGKIVMHAAAEFLTPVTLELGGKSPCIVDESADLKIAAKRIAWSKTINSGQTCIAPDYVLVANNLKEELMFQINEEWKKMYGGSVLNSDMYPKIIHKGHYDRLLGLINQEKVKYGGEKNDETLQISPTILDGVTMDDPVMKEEIFGPILPVIGVGSLNEAICIIHEFEKPLALYYYGNSHEAKSVLNKTSSGGVCINDAMMHIANPNLPFGGVGQSGYGAYHGYESFLCFTHKKAVVTTPTWIDLPFKYVPFKGFKWLKKFLT